MTGPTSSPQGLDQAASINCHEVRETLGAPRGISLTEWALVHAHVARCPACQKHRESLQLAVIAQRTEPSRRPGAKLIEHSRALVIATVRHVTPSARPVAISIERARLVIARVPILLMGLRSPLVIAVQGTARRAREAAGACAARALGLMSRVGLLASVSLTAATRAGATLIESIGAAVAGVGRRMPALVTPSVRAAASSIERARLVTARVPLLLTGLCSPLAIAVQGTARRARAAADAGAARVLGLASQVGVLASASLTAATRAGVTLIESTGAAVAGVGRRMPALVTPSVRAVGHGVDRARLAMTRVPHTVIRLRSFVIGGLREPARAAGQAAGAGVARVLGVLARLAVVAPILARSAARRIAARPRAYATLAGLAVLVPALLFLWPGQGLHDLGSRFSGRERSSREISMPIARTPVGPAAPVPFAVTSPPRPSAPPPPVAAVRPETPPVTVSHTPAEVPAPVRRRATAPAAPAATDAPSTETSDPAAAIDWLVKGASGRRQAESP